MRYLACTIVFTCLSIFLFAQAGKITKADLRILVNKMSGEFSSEEQSLSDSDFYHIKLRMKPIFKNNRDGYWLYVEQAMASAEKKPYRQRVYHVYIQDDTTIVSKVYEIKNPTKYIGGWENEALLIPLSIDSLTDRQGCSIYLHLHKDGTFSGSTPGKECLSVLRGATYATSEVSIYNEKVISWDRGWDKDDKQVWGAVKRGYIFKKIKIYE